MAIEMPPEMPPALTDIRHLSALYREAPTPSIAGNIGGTRVEIAGFPYLAKTQVQQLMEASRSPTQFIRALNKAYRRNGDLLVQILYRQEKGVVLVYVVQHQLTAVKGPPSIAKHFRDLVGDRDLKVTEFDRNRALAALKAERQGVDYSISYEFEPQTQSVAMELVPERRSDVERATWSSRLGNQGNRFAGQHTAGAGFNYSFGNGAEMAVDYVTALVGWGEGNGIKQYGGGSIQLNYPSTFGFNSLEGFYSAYRREVSLSQLVTSNVLERDIPGLCADPQDMLCTPSATEPLETEQIQEESLFLESTSVSLGLQGEQVVYSNPLRRFSVSQRLDWISETIDEKSRGTVLEETYGVLSLSGRYVKCCAREPSFVQLQVRAGLGGDDGTFSTESDEAVVAVGKRTARFVVLQPALRAGTDISANIRLGVDLSGQYSDGDQVPQMQQYVLGGLSTVSAYLPGVLVGDSGVYGRLWVRARAYQGQTLTLSPSLFVEHGRARFENAVDEAADVRAITDAGLRLVVDTRSLIKLELVAAWSLQERNLPADVLDDYRVDIMAQVSMAL